MAVYGCCLSTGRSPVLGPCWDSNPTESIAFGPKIHLTKGQRRMPPVLYQASVPVHTRQLNALSAILDKAAAYCAERKIDPNALLQARLFPDMFPLLKQVQVACSHAERGACRLSGLEPPNHDD